MSYYIEEMSSNCTIPLDSVPQACNLLYKALDDWYGEIELEQPSLDWLKELLDYMGFSITPRQDCVEIYFSGDRYNAGIEYGLNAIAPCVEEGSYFEIVGGNNSMWRWVFKNGKCFEIYPQITWPDNYV